jgi:hypothetical protein
MIVAAIMSDRGAAESVRTPAAAAPAEHNFCPLSEAPSANSDRTSALTWDTKVKVIISPPEAAAAGARWKLTTDAFWRESGVEYTNIAPGVFLMEFATIDRWLTPDWDHALVVQPESSSVTFVSYWPEPINPLTLSTGDGGFVRARSWSSLGAGWSNDDTAPDDIESSRWEAARFTSDSTGLHMPRNNKGYRVELRALTNPGYQFIGWAGDINSTRNPIKLIMNQPARIQANFARRLVNGYGATVSGDGYYSPGQIFLSGEISYPVAEQIGSLRLRPILPLGWTLIGVSGLGTPQVQQSEVVFTSHLGHNPIQFNLRINVPAAEFGPKEIRGQVEFEIVGMTNAIIRPVYGLTGSYLRLLAEPSPAASVRLELVDQHPSVTIEGMAGKTYTVQQLLALYPQGELSHFWWSMADLTLTNSIQTWSDSGISTTNLGTSFYRAILIQ